MKSAVFLFACLMAAPSYATVRLPEALGDHMVLQQNADVVLWGWAFAGEKVEVDASWGAKVNTVADAQGVWEVKLRTPDAQPLFQGLHPEHIIFSVPNENAVQISDILIGEVWLCAGQSNMDLMLRAGYPPGWGRWFGDAKWPTESQGADRAGLRLFNLARSAAATPQADCRSVLMSQGFDPPDARGHGADRGWIVCSPATAPYFHAVPYYFGAALQDKLGVPVGLVTSVVGGTVIESWMSLESLRTISRFANSAPVRLDPLGSNPAPACLFNGMIAPLTPMKIKGVAWYQGEGNVYIETPDYAELFLAMIGDWRRAFGDRELPFYFVQIAPYRYGLGSRAAELREAQASALSLPRTGMALSIDVGEADDIHPRDKYTVGNRLAAQALSKTYGLAKIVSDGPIAASATAGRGILRIRFQNVADGITTRDRLAPTCFQVGGLEGGFIPAQAIIDEDEVVVTVPPSLVTPRVVRFAWGETDIPNLMGSNGVPVRQFQLNVSSALDATAGNAR